MLVSLLLLLAVATPTAAPPPTDAALAARLTTRLEALAADRRFTGELRVSRGGEVIVHRGFGGVTVTPGQPGVYAIGSINKTFTAAGVLLLAQQGRLRLDDPLSRHFPELDPRRFMRDGRAVTLDDLLTHTSGLGMFLWPPWPDQRAPDAIVRMLAEAKVTTTPGRVFAYCNECYVVLGEVLHRVAGVPYDRFVSERISGPLGLVDTAPVPGADQRRRLLPGQVRSLFGLHPSQALMPHSLRKSYQWPAGADGSLRSTAVDLERFFLALAGPLLDPAMRDRMFTEHLQRNGRGIVLSPFGRDHRLAWHNGALSPLGYQSFAGVVLGPADQHRPPLTMVVLGNVDISALMLTPELLGAMAGSTPAPAAGWWSFRRAMHTVRFLRLGPALATLAVAVFLWRRRRRAHPLGRTLTAFGVLLALVAIGLAGARTPVFAGGMLAALIAGAAELRRPPSRKWNWNDPACVAALVTLLIALPVVALVLAARALLT
jgi:CubicO group peptidase (beta-lactamase class C family)